MRSAPVRILLRLAFCLLLGVSVYGFFSGKLFSQPIWTAEGERKLVLFACLYSAGFGIITVWKRSLVIPALVVVGLTYAAVCVGVLPLAAVAFFLLSALVLGRSIQALFGGEGTRAQHGDEILSDILALLLGLCPYLWLIGFLVRYPINYPLVYAALLAVPIVWRYRLAVSCLRCWCSTLRPVALEGKLAHAALGLAGFVFLAQWLVVWKPEASADGLAMHLAIPAAIANFHQFPFDVRHVAWAVMPMNGDWGFTAAYLLGGEYAARLFNFCLLALSVALVGRAVRRWLPAAPALLMASLLASSPLVLMLSGSLMVENTWTVLLLGALVALALHQENPNEWGLAAAATMCGTAVATKFGALASAAALAPLAGLSVIRMARTRQPRWRTKAIVAVLLLLVTAAPPYVHAYWKTGNPVFPFLNDVFQSPHFDSATSFVDKRFVTPLSWTTLFALTFRTHGFMESQDGAMGFHYLLLFPLSLLLLRRDWPYLAKAALWVSVASFLLVFRTQSNLRYVYPALVISMLPIALAVSRMKLLDSMLSRCVLGVAAVTVILNVYFLPSAAWHHRQFFLNPFRIGQEVDRYVEESAPARKLIEYVNRKDPGAPVAFIETSEIAGLRAKAYTNGWHNEAFCLRLNSAGSELECFQIMNNAGVAYVIAPTVESGIVPKPAALSRFLDDYTAPEFTFGSFCIAKLNRDEAGHPWRQGCPSQPASLRSALPGSHDDFSRFISFCGAWTRDSQFEQSENGTLTYADRVGSSFHFTFEGSEVVYVYTKAVNRGIASVTIDDEARGEIDLYSKSTVWRARTAFGNLRPGKHVMVVRVLEKKNPSASGYFVDLDALEAR